MIQDPKFRRLLRAHITGDELAKKLAPVPTDPSFHTWLTQRARQLLKEQKKRKAG